MKDGTFGTRKIQRTKQNNKVIVNNPSEDEQFYEVTDRLMGSPELNTEIGKNVRKTDGHRQKLKIAHRKEERRLQQEQKP
ncbi:hypothetical protein RhiirA4_476358 [Rhizophagus irregularis]|uniref:Uncharacterized protein n=1 Tax=Rhizophagus irregularis TaxID=588596 RepID=A0A2I1HBJ1_9GLOM|nr:hypothetical protein RhiirA4_476358 [Rhizophagus irregularis]